MAFDLSILAQPLAHKSNSNDFHRLTNTIQQGQVLSERKKQNTIQNERNAANDKQRAELTGLQIHQANLAISEAGKDAEMGLYAEFIPRLINAAKQGDDAVIDGMFQDRLAGIKERGVPDNHTTRLYDQFKKNPEQLGASLATEYSVLTQLGKLTPANTVDYQQAKGKGLEGFVFNPATGAFTVNPQMLELLQTNASELAETEGLLDPNQVAGVNNKVTALLKDTNDIREAASTLDTLEARSTPAAKIGAIFKFMKALDPTSTVRESEGRMILEAEGAMKGYAQRVNEMMGEGPLSETNFRDLVDTAKTMANGSIDSVTNTISGYLGVLDDKITPEDMQQMQSRVPQRFEISAGSGAKGDEYPEGTIITNGAGDKKILQGGRWVPVE